MSGDLMNKIISMSVWGNDPRYIVGTKRQVELAKKYYPEWKVRVYTDNPDNYPELQDEVDFYKVTDNSYGYFWRFFPMFENLNNVVMVRDSDGRITKREAKCINEWLDSGKSFHTFKDHEAHYEFPIIACSFAYRGKFDDALLNLMIQYMNINKFYLSDQYFLRDYIYPLVKDDMLLHSMDEEGWFKESRKLLPNKYSFCGNGYNEFDMPLYPNSLAEMESFKIENLTENEKFHEGVFVEN